mgnify:CR=1 FL=1
MDTEKNLLFLKETVDKTQKNLNKLISQIRPTLNSMEDELRNLYKISSTVESLLVKNNPLQTSLGDFDLDVRPFNLLRVAGVHTIGDLLSKTDDEIKDIDGVGEATFKNIKKVITDWQESQPKKFSETPDAGVTAFSFEDRVNPAGTL